MGTEQYGFQTQASHDDGQTGEILLAPQPHHAILSSKTAEQFFSRLLLIAENCHFESDKDFRFDFFQLACIYIYV